MISDRRELEENVDTRKLEGEVKSGLGKEMGIGSLLEEYERINVEYNDDSQEKSEKLTKILEQLKVYEKENSMLSDIITEIENKIQLCRNFSQQNKEIESMLSKENLNQENKENENPNKSNQNDDPSNDSTNLNNYHYAIYNKYLDEENEKEDFPRMTTKWFNKFLCSNFKLYYRTYELNECLYLHFKGFRYIENLEPFVNLKVLYLEGNAIRKISGLEKCVNLISLYLHQNLIEKIEGLDTLTNLYNLNLSENCITKIENLENLVNLQNLILKRNRIGINGIQDLEGVKNLKNISVIDVSENCISDPEAKEIFFNIPTLRVIYLQGNECIRKISHYRKTMIASIKELRYLDDKPVFEDERRFAEAFARGGLDCEKKERELYRKEKQEAELQRIKDFRDMVDNWRGNKEGKENIESSNKESSITAESEEEKKQKEKEKEEQRRKLLMKCKNKSNKLEIKEESIDLTNFEGVQEIQSENKNNLVSQNKKNQIFDDNDTYDLPDLETIKNKKESGYVEYILEKEKYNLDNGVYENENRNREEESEINNIVDNNTTINTFNTAQDTQPSEFTTFVTQDKNTNTNVNDTSSTNQSKNERIFDELD